MKRRKLLLGIGTVAGSGGVVSSGAFTSVDANRSMNVAVAGDANAMLALRGCDGPNGAYVTGAGTGAATIDLSESNPKVVGDGVNDDAVSRFDDVLEIRNQGTQPVGVWLEANPATYDGRQAIEFYRSDQPGTEVVYPNEQSLSLAETAICLDVGESLCVGFVIRTDLPGVSSGEDLFGGDPPGSNGEQLVVNADAAVACGSGTPGMGSGPLRLSTGVADWEVVSVPPSATETVPRMPYDAAVVESPPSAWATSNTDAEWVDPFDTGGLRDDPADADDPYVYELDVPVSGTLVIEEYGSDNPVELFLDGTSIGGSDSRNAFGSLRSNISNQRVRSGDTLRAEVINEPGSSGNPTGLLVAARLE